MFSRTGAGNGVLMDVHKVIRKRIRESSKGVNVAGDVNAVISANVGERGRTTHTSSSSKQRIVQRSGSQTHRDDAAEEEGEEAGGGEAGSR